MDIPSHARKVFSGIIFDTYQREQELYNGTRKTFEMIKRSYAANIIPIRNGKIVLEKQMQPGKDKRYYSLVSGRIEKGEKPEEAVKRELLEETGLMSDHIFLRCIYEQFGKIDRKIYSYIAKDCKKIKEQELDGGEKIEILVVSFDEFIDIVLSKEFDGVNFSNDIFRYIQKNELHDLKSLLGVK